MGEAGPEAIMPLKRGNNGKLGVEVAGRSNAIDAMNRYSMRNNAGGVAGFGPTGDQAAEGLEAAPQPIDVRYNVERINSVDYVTADQFQAGMRQAASQGAKQGEQQTLRRLQMSGSTRKRVGM
jgi:phage-related minor tail protein